MAQYNMTDLGLVGDKTGFPFFLIGAGQCMYQNVSFPQDIKISSLAMQVGQAYGYTTEGKWVNPAGSFYGRYCIWDASGYLVAQSGVVRQGSYYGFNANRPYTWGNMTSQPVLKKNTTYRIGYYRASTTSSDYFSLVARSRTWNDGNKTFRSQANVTRATINSGAGNITGRAWSQYFTATNPYLVINLLINYEKANTAPRKWNGSWADNGLKMWNGSSWVDVRLKKWTGSWVDVD